MQTVNAIRGNQNWSEAYIGKDFESSSWYRVPKPLFMALKQSEQITGYCWKVETESILIFEDTEKGAIQAFIEAYRDEYGFEYTQDEKAVA